MTEEQVTRDSKGRFVSGVHASPATEIKKGQKLSEETCAKMKGRVPWNKGKKLPEMSGELNPFFGRQHTEEARRRCGEINKGRTPTEKQLAALKLARVPGHNKGVIPIFAFPPREAHPFFVQSDRSHSKRWGGRWFVLKNQILIRDNHTCQKCGTQKNLHVHHIVPARRGGDDSPSNLITVCAKCHKRLEIPLLIEDHRAGVFNNV